MLASGAGDGLLYGSVLVQEIPLADGENDAQVLQELVLVSSSAATSEALQPAEDRDRIKPKVVLWEAFGETTGTIFGD